jgi:UDP-N-acetylglucosamine:LPS N-acetylglucosamine transferase
MRVLFISEGYSIGGTSRVMSRLSSIFVEGGIEVDILVPNYRADEAYPLADGCQLYYIAQDDRLKSKFLLAIDLFKFFFQLIELTKNQKYDCVISFWNYVNLALLIAPIDTTKIICTHISFQSLKPHWKILTRLFYPLAASVVVLNQREKDIYDRFCPRVDIIENPLPSS